MDCRSSSIWVCLLGLSLAASSVKAQPQQQHQQQQQQHQHQQQEYPDISLDHIEDPPEGYYAFIESPNAEPPRVRRPPYIPSEIECPGAKAVTTGHSNHKPSSLCGDLNKGYIPKNPMNQNVLGASYPFELIKNKTLQFFSKTLPILKADETLPKVAKYKYYLGEDNTIPNHNYRSKREIDEETVVGNETVTSGKRTARKFCDNNDGVLCTLYKAIQGDSIFRLGNGFQERRDDNSELPEYRRGEVSLPVSGRENSLPPTPCPAKVEYATPVFARNYQGVWRYVVQIPYEGYFTQTIEVTRCLNSRCHYMEGGCMSSPRWTSILVAEIYYPETFLPSRPKISQRSGNLDSHVVSSLLSPSSSSSSNTETPTVQDFQNYQQYLQKRAGTDLKTSESEEDTSESNKKNVHCDGVDDIGCFQVRLYYDWFLVPGSCKCWRPDYFSRYMRRKSSSTDL